MMLDRVIRGITIRSVISIVLHSVIPVVSITVMLCVMVSMAV